MAYIDKEKFRMHIIRYQRNPLKVILTDKEKEKFIRMLDEVPTADVVEVKHGKWIYDGIRGRFPACRCSVCGAVENADWAIIQDGANFCPHCGADMREEIADD